MAEPIAYKIYLDKLNQHLSDVKQKAKTSKGIAYGKIKGGKTTGTEREQRLLANDGIEIKIQTK